MGPSGAASQVTAKKTKSKPKPLTDEEKALTRPFTKYLPDTPFREINLYYQTSLISHMTNL